MPLRKFCTEMIKKIKRYWEIHPQWREKCRCFFRFGITGGISSAVHYGVYCAMLLISGANIAFTVGYAVGFACNYLLTTFFTFRTKPSSTNAIGFGFSHLINYLLEMGMLNFFLWTGAARWLAALLAMSVAVPVNFLILYFVYLHKEKS